MKCGDRKANVNEKDRGGGGGGGGRHEGVIFNIAMIYTISFSRNIRQKIPLENRVYRAIFHIDGSYPQKFWKRG